MIEFRTDSKWRMLLLLAIAVVFGLNTALPTAIAASGNVYYVAPDGNDSNPGALNSPFRTIQHCLDIVQPGDTCLIRRGTYNEALVLRTSGTESSRIMIRNYNGEIVTIDSGNSQTLRTGGRRHCYTIEGLRFTTNHRNHEDSDATLNFGDGVWDGVSPKSGGNNGFIIRDCYIEGAIHFYGHNNIVENCELNGRGEWGNGIIDWFGPSHDNVYRNNEIYGYSPRGVWSMQYTENILIEGNVIHDIVGSAIDLDGAGPSGI